MFSRAAVLAASVAAASALATISAQAQSFACSNAVTPTEHAICDNPQLSKLDESTAGMYYSVISSGGLSQRQVNRVKYQQAAFLRQRNSCGANYSCLVDAYTSQMMYLKNVQNP